MSVIFLTPYASYYMLTHYGYNPTWFEGGVNYLTKAQAEQKKLRPGLLNKNLIQKLYVGSWEISLPIENNKFVIDMEVSNNENEPIQLFLVEIEEMSQIEFSFSHVSPFAIKRIHNPIFNHHVINNILREKTAEEKWRMVFSKDVSLKSFFSLFKLNYQDMLENLEILALRKELFPTKLEEIKYLENGRGKILIEKKDGSRKDGFFSYLNGLIYFFIVKYKDNKVQERIVAGLLNEMKLIPDFKKEEVKKRLRKNTKAQDLKQQIYALFSLWSMDFDQTYLLKIIEILDYNSKERNFFSKLSNALRNVDRENIEKERDDITTGISVKGKTFKEKNKWDEVFGTPNENPRKVRKKVQRKKDTLSPIQKEKSLTEKEIGPALKGLDRKYDIEDNKILD